MTLLEKLGIIASTVGGAGFLNKIVELTNRKQLRSKNILIDNINYWKKEHDKMKQDREDLLNLNNLLRIELSSIYNKRECVPIPMWEKDKFGRMVWCNEIYETAFLKPIRKNRASFYGLTDVEYLGETARNWSENDLTVMSTGKGWFGVESLNYSNSDLLENWKIFKDVIKTDGIITGTIGVAMKID